MRRTPAGLRLCRRLPTLLVVAVTPMAPGRARPQLHLTARNGAASGSARRRLTRVSLRLRLLSLSVTRQRRTAMVRCRTRTVPRAAAGSRAEHLLSPCAPHVCAGLPPGLAARLRTRAEHIINASEGKFVASGPPALVGIVLDGLLVLAQDAIDAFVTAAAEPKPAVRAQLKTLGWLVADAMGQLTPWPPDVALTVGKRLEKRVSIVRGSISDDLPARVKQELMSAPCPTGLPELELPAAAAPEEAATPEEAASSPVPTAAEPSSAVRTRSGHYDGQPRLPYLLVQLLGERATAEVYKCYRRNPIDGSLLPPVALDQDDEFYSVMIGSDAGQAVFKALKMALPRLDLAEQSLAAERALGDTVAQATQLQAQWHEVGPEVHQAQLDALVRALVQETARADRLQARVRALEGGSEGESSDG